MKKSSLIPRAEWIVQDNVEQLHRPCQEVVLPLRGDDLVCVKKMMSYIDACFNNEAKKFNIIPGIGIAAPQLGHYKQMFYINFVDNEAKHHQLLMANPTKIVESAYDTYLADGEGCLSVKETYKGYSRRKIWVVIEGYDLLKKEKIRFKAFGMFGICVQHELDHLRGLLFYDRINKLDPFHQLETDKVIS